VGNEDKLIKDYQFELAGDHHNIGSGLYHVRVTLPADISASFPYLNAVLEDSIYDHENCILIGFSGKRRYAFRPHEIQLGIVADTSEAPSRAEEAVNLVNRVWAERGSITPSYIERQIPPVFEIYKMLPGKNCRECGYTTCLAYAAELRTGKVALDKCVMINEPEYSENRERLSAFFPPAQE
jgi:ArsR family metal-binding transcriptional regulator